MTSQPPTKPTSARHPTDYLSLIFGLIFLAAAGWWAASYYLDWVVTINLPDAGWVLAAGLILLGLIGIVASLRRDRPAAEPASTGSGDRSDPALATMDAGPPSAPPAPSTPPASSRRPGEPGGGPDRPAPGDPGGHRPE